jgi:hypothetical protein
LHWRFSVPPVLGAIAISTGDYSRTASENIISTDGFLKQTASGNIIFTGDVFYLAASGSFPAFF